MRKEEVLEFVRKKGTLGALTLCLVGAVAFVSYQTSYQKEASQQKNAAVEDSGTAEELEEDGSQASVSSGNAIIGLSGAETPDKTEDSSSAGADTASVTADETGTADAGSVSYAEETAADGAESEAQAASAGADAADTGTYGTAANETTGDETAENGTDAEEDTAVWSSGVLQPTVSFGEASSLTWPAAGTVLMDYNMNGTVYFQTLNEYKYNPALIIASETGNPVVASAKGIVESIEQDEETGTTLTLNIGDDYQLIYGQLTDLAVAEGDVAEQGQLLGYIAEPTKYYCEEGSNLYFAMKKDGESVDPGLYLEG